MHDSFTLTAMTNPEITTIKKMSIKVDNYGYTLVEGDNQLNICVDFHYKTFLDIFRKTCFDWQG